MFQKQSALKLVDRTILHKHGYNTPPLGAELGSRACPGVHTRDLKLCYKNSKASMTTWREHNRFLPNLASQPLR
jgi:hypothetical protein